VPESLKARALKLLARREHSRAELGRKLAAHSEDAAEIDRLLDELESRGWLSERRVAEQMVHARRSRFGMQRIERDLLAKGVSGEVVAGAMQDLKEGELAAAREVWRKKFGGRLPRNQSERGKQARFLQGRGFGMDVILKIIKGGDEQ
jgi:regulatory protein